MIGRGAGLKIRRILHRLGLRTRRQRQPGKRAFGYWHFIIIAAHGDLVLRILRLDGRLADLARPPI